MSIVQWNLENKISLNEFYSQMGLSETNRVKWIRRNLIGTSKRPTIYKEGIDYIITSSKANNNKVVIDYLINEEVAMNLALQVGTEFGLHYRNKIIFNDRLKIKELQALNKALKEEINSIYDSSISLPDRVHSLALNMPKKPIYLSELYTYSTHRIGKNKLYKELREKGLLNKNNVPTSLSFTKGYFVNDGNGYMVSKVGFNFIMKLIQNTYKMITKEANKEDVLNILEQAREGLIFDEVNHVYTVNGIEYKSVSTILKKYIPEFPTNFMSERVAAKRTNETGIEVTKEDVLKEWELKRDIAANFGSYIHYELEKYASIKYLNNKPVKELTIDMDVFKELMPKAELLIQSGMRWLDKMALNGYELIDTEVMMFSRSLNYSGTVDLLFLKDGEFVIADWKSNQKDIVNDSYDNYMYNPFDSFKNSTINKYHIQLNLYQQLFESITPYSVSNNVVVHLQEDGVKTYKSPYLIDML